jgi:hypothetical protein
MDTEKIISLPPNFHEFLAELRPVYEKMMVAYG